MGWELESSEKMAPDELLATWTVSDATLELVERYGSRRQGPVRTEVNPFLDDAEEGAFATFAKRAAHVKRSRVTWDATQADNSERLRDLAALVRRQREGFSRKR